MADKNYRRIQCTLRNYRDGLYAMWSYGYNDWVRTPNNTIIVSKIDYMLDEEIVKYYPNFMKD